MCYQGRIAVITGGRLERLMAAVRRTLRTLHHGLQTERAYVHWIRRFVMFSGRRHPRELGGAEVAGFLSHLAIEDETAAATQNQAHAALLFLYRKVLGQEPVRMADVARAKRSR
jgi:hypothetical protein